MSLPMPDALISPAWRHALDAFDEDIINRINKKANKRKQSLFLKFRHGKNYGNLLEQL